MNISEFNLLVNEIKIAVTYSVGELFNKHPNEDFYYISLITSGEAHSPILSAWSYQELRKLSNNDKEEERLIKWSYADSPYTRYKNTFFQKVEQIFESRDTKNINERDFSDEFDFRINAMVAAMHQADVNGVFGNGDSRLNLLINVEVMPPDETNVIRAKELNPKNSKILPIWIEEAGEE